MGNLIPVTEMKNVQKDCKIPVERTAFRLVSDLTSHAQLKMFRPVQSTVPVSGLECSYGKIFQLGYRDLGRKNRDLGNRARPPSHMKTPKFFCKEESGEARSRKPSQPGRPGSYEEALRAMGS